MRPDLRLALIGCLCLAACGQPAGQAQILLTGDLPVAAPASVQAGEAVAVTVGPAPAADGAPVTLIALGSYGPRLYAAEFQNGLAEFQLPPDDTRQAGWVTLAAAAGEARGQAHVRVQPGPPVEPLTPLVGARSIVADGAHWSMAVVVPFDRHGNPVADGTPVRVRALHPGDRLEERTVFVRHLLAWARLYSGTRAGQTTVAVESLGRYGPEAVLLEVPGWPTPFGLAADVESLPADGRRLAILRTGTIQDQYGNIMPDGTLVTFVAQAPDGRRRFIPAYTLDGVAEAPLQAAAEPGLIDIWAVVYGVESRRLQMAFTPGPAVGAFPLAASLDSAAGVLVLKAGPMLGQLNQYLPDGTVVLFRIEGAAGPAQWLAAQSEAGYASVTARLADLAPGRYTAVALAGSGRGTVELDLP